MVYEFGPGAINDLTPETIAAIRQSAIDRGIDAFLLLALRRYALPTRVRLAIERAYHQKLITKPVDQLKDQELSLIRNIGPKSLAAIRKVLPPPGKNHHIITREDIIVRET